MEQLPPGIQDLILDQTCVVEAARSPDEVRNETEVCDQAEMRERLAVFIRETIAQHGTT